MKNNKYVVVESRDRECLIEALQDFANLYNHQKFSQCLQLFHEMGDIYIIEMSALDEEHFQYAVNYLRYPENKATFESVLGYDLAKGGMYYVPEDDTDCDNCYVVYRSGEARKNSFDGSSQNLTSSIEYTEYNFEPNRLNIVCTVVAAKPQEKGLFSWLFG